MPMFLSMPSTQVLKQTNTLSKWARQARKARKARHLADSPEK